MFNLKSKVAIVTGATKGIGRASALALAQQGAAIVASGRNEEEGKTLVDQIVQAGGRAIFIAADVRRAIEVERLFDESKRLYGQIDIAFLNSGVYRFSPILEQTEADLMDQFDVNVKGVYFGLQLAAKHMSPGGSIIITSSTVADFGMPGASAYSLTKGAINALVRTAAVELADSKIRVNAVSPGPIWTEGLEQMTGARDSAEQAMSGLTVLKRLGTAEEIAAGVVFLASDEAAYITGQILPIDGGIVIH